MASCFYGKFTISLFSLFDINQSVYSVYMYLRRYKLFFFSLFFLFNECLPDRVDTRFLFETLFQIQI